MPPKGKKGKKGKKDDWSGDELGEQLPVLNKPATADSDEEEVAAPSKSRFSAFSMDDSKDPEADDEEDDGGGLMGAISAVKAPAPKKDKKSKKKKPDFADLEENDVPEGEANEVESKAPVAVSADDWLDAEFGDKKAKKGGKKGSKKAKAVIEEEDEETAAKESPITPVAQAEPEEDDGDEQEDASAKPLSKKEKEKLKKQRQKEKEKAAKAKSKPAAAVSTPTETPAEPESQVAATEEPDEETAEGAGETAASKNKKKKKKAGAAKEETPAPAKGGKVSKQVLAMREALAKQQAAEAAQKEAEEAERRRIEEEEQREKDEVAKVEAARLAKKQKQKDKEALQKAQGTFKTPAQKKEEARLAARREATLASGAKIAGLEEDKDAAPAKKVVYGNKKKGPAKKSGPRVLDNLVLLTSEEPASPSAVTEEAQSPKVEEVKAEPVVEKQEVADVKDDWDAGSGDDLKDSWDAESEDEASAPKKVEVKSTAKETKAPSPAAAPKKEAVSKQAKKEVPKVPVPVKAAPASVKKPETNGKTQPRSAPVEESSSEEESESESESGSETDSDDSDSEDDSDESSSEDERISAGVLAEQKRKAELAERKKARVAAAIANRDVNDLRSPICCILGHVDTGKTKLLDKIRQTNVQEGEAGGITQQIGATYFPIENVRKKTVVLGDADLKEYKLPGLLVIDTPGHESFTNLRTRGSSLCNIAILVVDIVHGLEPQTLESLRLLRDKKTPFIVALNKIDRMYGWKAIPDAGFQETYEQQSRGTKSEFEDRLKKTIVEFAEQGLNAAPYYENKDLGRTVSLVPTSAITGEGIPDMLMLIIKLTQERMSNNLMYLSELECTVLEVKVIEGLGTTIDVVLSNGILREGDRIVICGLNGAISTQVRALLTPQPLKEMRVKGSYVHHKEVKASLGIKIVAPDLEKAIAGSRLLLLTEDDDEEELKQEVMNDLKSLLNSVDRSGKGVWVQASTLGALEALLDFLKSSKIPVAGINIGPVYKRDIMRAAVMLERAPEYAVCLCFDVAIDKDAEKLADEYGIKLFRADIIYHLFDAFTAHNKAVLEAKQKDAAPTAVWPCRLKTLACFAKRDPIILGVDIIEGSLRIGTPLAVVKKDPETGKKVIHSLGRITSMEINHKTFTKITRSQVGAGVAIKIEHAVYENGKMFGRHFDDKDELISLVSRKSIDTLKNVFRSEVEKSDWALIVKLKAQLDVA